MSEPLRVAILTPDPGGSLGGTRWPPVLARLTAPLAAAGIKVDSRPWTLAGDLTEFDLVLPLLAWGYHREGDWPGQVARWRDAGVRLQNPAAVLLWNADKSYLGRFAAAGAPVVPTLFVERLDEAALEAAAARFGTGALIAKPRVSASAFQTIRWSAGTTLAGGPDRAAIVQPFLPDIEAGGELSLIYLGGTFSHAIRKRPQPGDFRVQPEFDGINTPHDPLPEEVAAAEAALRAAGEDLLYARVDLVRDLAGAPVLMEIELVEPDLYLEHAPGSEARFAAAVRRAASEDRPAPPISLSSPSPGGNRHSPSPLP
jgi:glutathione synthase/RimK-type ligase-like ATP-grasp enzyme